MIYCEGQTERMYLTGFINDFCLNQKLVELPLIKENTVDSIIKRIIEDKYSVQERLSTTDQYWAVYDRESLNKYSDELHDKAYKKEQVNHISIAISNVCFEQWLLLHFNNSCASYDSYDDLMSSSNLKSELKKLVYCID